MGKEKAFRFKIRLLQRTKAPGLLNSLIEVETVGKKTDFSFNSFELVVQ